MDYLVYCKDCRLTVRTSDLSYGISRARQHERIDLGHTVEILDTTTKEHKIWRGKE